jgi:hypothetical protein
LEEISWLQNGQWELCKMAWGTPIYDHLDHGNNPIKDSKKAHEAKMNVADSVRNHKVAKHKTMSNLSTGKDEPHVLLHRGISDQGGDMEPKKGPNMIHWDDDHINTSHNSIHSLNPDEAMGHAEDHDDHGITHSFWVPISSIHGTGEYIDNHFKAKDQGDKDHVMIGPGQYRRESSNKVKWQGYGDYHVKQTYKRKE